MTFCHPGPALRQGETFASLYLYKIRPKCDFALFLTLFNVLKNYNGRNSNSLAEWRRASFPTAKRSA